MTRDVWNHSAASVPDSAPPSVSPSVAEARDKRKRLEWLATISPRHEIELRRVLAAAARAREIAELRAFVADIKGQTPPDELRAFVADIKGQTPQAELRAFVADITGMSEAEWDPSKHPRGGFPDNAGKFSQASGAGRSTPENRLADAVLKRNSMVT